MKACEFLSLIHECSSEVLDTMYFTTVRGTAPPRTTEADEGKLLACSLQFSGDVSGRFGIQLNQTAARILAANFLGQADADISCEDVTEVVGELANILCGSVMSRVERENPFILSHPLAGPPMPPGGDLMSCALVTDSGSITVWVLIEVDL